MNSNKFFTLTDEQLKSVGTTSIAAIVVCMEGLSHNPAYQTMARIAAGQAAAANAFADATGSPALTVRPIAPAIMERVLERIEANITANVSEFATQAEALIERMRFITAQRVAIQTRKPTVH